VIDPAVAAYRGRVVKLMGDGLLAEFGSVVDAVECAVAVQLGSLEHNIKMPSNRRIVLRIGINVGDVIVADGDIFGDGVNVAARLQEIAEPGTICISGAAFDQIEGKLAHGFVELGQQRLKNIAKPIRAYGFQPQISNRPSPSAPRPFLDRPTRSREPITGGCLCGAIRYEIAGSDVDSGICHCKMCQKFTGSAFTIWACYPKEAVRFTRGEPKYYKHESTEPTYYQSSPIGERGFCPNCGSGLSFRGTIPDWAQWIFIYCGTLDDPKNFQPKWHLGTESQLPWLDMNDDLPRVRCYDSPAKRRSLGKCRIAGALTP